MSKLTVPMRPEVRLRVGVTGHRPGLKLPDTAQAAIAKTIERVFKALSDGLAPTVGDVRWAFGAGPAALAVVSPLAEGADRLVAQAGLAAGASLDVVLPASQAIYEEDFETDASKAEFRALLAQAQSVFVIDRPEGSMHRKRGYEAAGLIMLAHADLLIAVWDEGEPDGIGGTAAIVGQAVGEGAPVLLINPATPDRVRLLWTGDLVLTPDHVRIEELPDRDALPLLPKVLAALIAPPSDPEALAGLRAFYLESTQRSRGWPIYKMFLWTVGVRALHRSDFLDVGARHDPAEDWRARFPSGEPPDPLTHRVCQTLLPAVAAGDRLAIRFSDLYRSAFVFNFIFAAVAVSLALLGLVSELHWVGFPEIARLGFKAGMVTMEIGVISLILVVWRLGARHYWHQRWLNYRRVAEWLRHLRILTLVGARSPIARPRHAPAPRGEAARGSRREQDDWVSWYVRSVERMLPLPNRVADMTYLTEVRGAVVGAELDGQIEYHRDNSHLMATLAHRLHLNGVFLFAAPVVVGLAFLAAFALQVLTGWEVAEHIRFYVTALTAAFPTFGAALNAVRVQGDFETAGQRSAATAARLAIVRDALQTEPLEFPRLADRTQHAAEVMSLDLAEWQTLVRTRPLGLPA